MHSDNPQRMMSFNTFSTFDTFKMEPHTRRRLDTVLGWMGYSLSYTEQNSTALAGGPTPDNIRASRATVAPRTAMPVSTRQSAASTFDRRQAAMQMLEAFAEGLQVCARLAARFVRAGYLYTSERVREHRDRDDARLSASDTAVRLSMRERLDESLERVLDALETRVLSLSPMPAFRRARAAWVAGANARIDRIAEQMSQLATKLSPTRAFRRSREAVEAKVGAVADGVTKRADLVADGVQGLVSRNRDASVDRNVSVDAATDAATDHDAPVHAGPLARVCWPEQRVTTKAAEVETEAPAAESPADEDSAAWPERSALERLEMMLSSNVDLTPAPGKPEDSERHEHRGDR